MRGLPAEDGVGSIAGAAFEKAAAEMTLCFYVTDEGLDSGAAPELTLDTAEDPALLPRDEDASWIFHVVAAVSLVNPGALDLAASEPLRVFETPRSVWPS